MKVIHRRLVRSKSLVNSTGHNTWRYRWTECTYLFGYLIRSIQVNNLDYNEALAVFGSDYTGSMMDEQRRDQADWWQTFIYNPTKKPLA